MFYIQLVPLRCTQFRSPNKTFVVFDTIYVANVLQKIFKDI